jgi:hypothetical protein
LVYFPTASYTLFVLKESNISQYAPTILKFLLEEFHIG